MYSGDSVVEGEKSAISPLASANHPNLEYIKKPDSNIKAIRLIALFNLVIFDATLS
jgi:hypothetical protein